jgi:hypothetical protein
MFAKLIPLVSGTSGMSAAWLHPIKASTHTITVVVRLIEFLPL